MGPPRGSCELFRAADEDEHEALLGTSGADQLSAADQVMLRLIRRSPVQVNAFRVAPQDLTRLVNLMDERWSQRGC